MLKREIRSVSGCGFTIQIINKASSGIVASENGLEEEDSGVSLNLDIICICC
jgi:hypothetical protein